MPVDFPFLAEQTFGDETLEREVLDLFVEQARRVVTAMGAQSAAEQDAAAHLLKGSACGIGAWSTAEAADLFGTAASSDRAARLAVLEAAVTEAAAAIRSHLARIPSRPT